MVPLQCAALAAVVALGVLAVRAAAAAALEVVGVVQRHGLAPEGRPRGRRAAFGGSELPVLAAVELFACAHT